MNNDNTMVLIKELLSQKSQEYLIDELLKSYWKHPELLDDSEVWKNVLEIQKRN